MKPSDSGQILLIAVGIMMVLLISIPTIVFINSMGIRHQTQSQKLTQGRSIAEAGIAYASAQLSSDENIWKQAVGGNFSSNATVQAMCNSSANGVNVTGTQFRIKCSINTTDFPGLQPYEVAVVATAWLPGPDGQLTPAKALQVFLNRRTLGIFTSAGMRASAALQLAKVPALLAPLTVHWGPIACLDTALWTLVDPLDQNPGVPGSPQGHPRKFSMGPITGSGTPVKFVRSPNTTISAITTDSKEYWAYTPMEFPATVNEFDYASTNAEINTAMPLPTGCGVICTQIQGAISWPGSGHIVTNGATPIFDNTFIPAYNPPTASGTKVIYVQGNATWKDLAMDMGTDGAFIVTGNLTLNASAATTLSIANMKIPQKAPQEYAYWPTSALNQWPCASDCNPSPPTGAGMTWKDASPTCPTVNPTCSSPISVNFHGFLWVKGNLVVNGPWVLAGAVLVGDPSRTTTDPQQGQLQVSAGGSLTLYYDDQVNHSIHVNPR